MRLNGLLRCEFILERKEASFLYWVVWGFTYTHSTGMWRAVSCPLRQENLCLHSLPRHLPYQRSRSSPGKEKPFPAEPGKPLGSTLFCHFKSYATLTWSMTGISTNYRLFICSDEDRALILHAFKTVWKCLFFVSQCVCFWISPSLQFLISSSQSAEAFIAAVYLCGSMREQCLRTLWFLWGWWVLCLKKLDSSGKFLPFFFSSSPLALKVEKRRKLPQGKVLTGRLVYDLIFNWFFTYIWEECHNY